MYSKQITEIPLFSSPYTRNVSEYEQTNIIQTNVQFLNINEKKQEKRKRIEKFLIPCAPYTQNTVCVITTTHHNKEATIYDGKYLIRLMIGGFSRKKWLELMNI